MNAVARTDEIAVSFVQIKIVDFFVLNIKKVRIPNL